MLVEQRVTSMEDVVMPRSTLADRCLQASDEVGNPCTMSTDHFVHPKGDSSGLPQRLADHCIQTKSDEGDSLIPRLRMTKPMKKPRLMQEVHDQRRLKDVQRP